MDQEKIGKFIKEIRKKNNLTQAQFADKYQVTYQAVSKWENGKNMPDVSLLKQMSKDFDVNIEDLLEGEYCTEKKKKYSIWIFVCIILLLILMLFLFFHHKSEKNFEFKTLSSSCNEFNISGSIAYNQNKSSIYISTINYCGGDDSTLYREIECTLYETHNHTETKIKTYHYQETKGTTLEAFLQDIKVNVDNYGQTCKKYSENSLFLQIHAIDEKGKTTYYKVPLSLKENCDY